MKALVLWALVGSCAGTGPAAQEAVRSGYDYMTPETRALQDDDFLNPGFFLIEKGLSLWQSAMPGAGLACAECHGPIETAMKGVASRYPVFDPALGRIVNLELRVLHEMTERLGIPAPVYESPEVLALTALISYQSRGIPMQPNITSQSAPLLERGRQIFEQRRGQLHLSCAQCHVEQAGNKLRGDVISQGQVNAFPIYRLIWGEVGSRHRMFRWCMQAVRAQPYDFGSEDYLALELYLANRGAGLPIESPGVRR